MRPYSSVALAALLSSLVGCKDVEFAQIGAGHRSTFVSKGSSGGGSGPLDHYLRVAGKKAKKPGKVSVAYPCDLWGPFRWEATAGLMDAAHAQAADGAIFGTELDGRGSSPPTVFYGISAQVINGGLNVFAFTHQSSQSIGSKFYAGATEVDFAIESNGSQLEFLARKRGDPAFDSLATIAFAQGEALVPTIGVFNLLNKGAVGFDLFRIVSNSQNPFGLTAEQAAAQDCCDAMAPLFEAGYAVDGVNPDFAAGQADVAQALTALDTAKGSVQALPKSKARKKALSFLKKARKKALAAQKKLQTQDPKTVGKALKLLRQSAVFAGKASNRLYPVS